MTQIDQFESVFRSAAKERFVYEPVSFAKALLVTDMEPDVSTPFAERVKHFVAVLEDEARLEWQVLNKGAFETTEDLLSLVDLHEPDLICTYRNLNSKAWRHPHSLGEYLDVLTQKTDMPVLVLPHPEAGYALDGTMDQTATVMAVTDHLLGESSLINHALHFTRKDGTLYLAHVEDQKNFDRYMEAISKIPTIDTEDARRRIGEKLLSEPRDYIASAEVAVKEAGIAANIKAHVAFGHHLSEYNALISDHRVDLLVINTKDEDQTAMHGLAYPLAIELRQIPILML